MLYDRIVANQGRLRLRLDDSAVGRRPGERGDGLHRIPERKDLVLYLGGTGSSKQVEATEAGNLLESWADGLQEVARVGLGVRWCGVASPGAHNHDEIGVLMIAARSGISSELPPGRRSR